MNNNENQANGGEAKAKPEVIKLGLDLHARQVTECRQLDGSTPKPAQKWDPWQLLDQVEKWVKAGSSVYSCYEAGACGYWYHRELVKREAINFVVAPEPLENERRRRQKTDRLDAHRNRRNTPYAQSPRSGMSLFKHALSTTGLKDRLRTRPYATFLLDCSPDDLGGARDRLGGASNGTQNHV
jgi:hypothetical protein